MNRGALGLLLLLSCGKAATKEQVVTKDAGVAEAAAVVIADAAPAPVTTVYPVIQGACPPARPVLVGKTPMLHFAKAAWAIAPDGTPTPVALQPKAVYSIFLGGMLGETDRLGSFGGQDEEHVWYTMGSSSTRGEDHSFIMLGGKRLETPHGGMGVYGIQNVIQQPDGSIWAFGFHSMYLDIPGDEAIPKGDDLPAWRYNKWFAWSKDGTPLKINLPQGDMELAVRLDNGELVAAGISKGGDHPQLRRWSPTRKVSDFTMTESADFRDLPEVRVGSARAVVRLKDKPIFYSYDGGDKFGLSPLAARAKNPSSWLVTKNDDLLIATDDNKLFIETKAGVVTEEALPERGWLARETSTPWFMGDSGAIYERADGAWRKVTLLDGLWSDGPHPLNHVEWVAVLGSETWVSTVRADKGFGYRNPTEIRTIYSSKERATMLRCGSPFENSMLFPLAPRADVTCKDLVVLLGRERGKDGKLAIPYAKIAAALKGDESLHESLTLGIFRSTAYGIHAPTREIADVLTKKLAHVTLHEPEIVCGALDETKTATLDVKAGAFTSIPDAGAP